MFLVGCAHRQPASAAVSSAGDVVNPLRQGRVYLVRGLLGTFSTGMDDLRDELKIEGVEAITLQHTAGREAVRELIKDDSPGPVIIVGHSLGADAAVGMTRLLNESQREVELMITLDPVYPPAVPANVREAINFYRKGFALLPLFRGAPLKADNQRVALRNIDVGEIEQYMANGANHFNIDTNRELQRRIVELVLEHCPPTRSTETYSSTVLSLRK